MCVAQHHAPLPQQWQHKRVKSFANMSQIIRRLRRMEERWDNVTEAYHTHPLIRQTKRKIGYYGWVGTVYVLMGTGCYLFAFNVMMLINKERKARLEGPLLARKQRDTVASKEVLNAVEYATHLCTRTRPGHIHILRRAKHHHHTGRWRRKQRPEKPLLPRPPNRACSAQASLSDERPPVTAAEVVARLLRSLAGVDAVREAGVRRPRCVLSVKSTRVAVYVVQRYQNMRRLMLTLALRGQSTIYIFDKEKVRCHPPTPVHETGPRSAVLLLLNHTCNPSPNSPPTHTQRATLHD